MEKSRQVRSEVTELDVWTHPEAARAFHDALVVLGRLNPEWYDPRSDERRFAEDSSQYIGDVRVITEMRRQIVEVYPQVDAEYARLVVKHSGELRVRQSLSRAERVRQRGYRVERLVRTVFGLTQKAS